MEELKRNNIVLGRLDNDIVYIKKDISKHIYRRLNSFCISEALFNDNRINNFIFITEFYNYEINKEQLIEFMKDFNCWIQNEVEKQIAIPLVAMKITHVYSKNIENEGYNKKEFLKIIRENEKYQQWGYRNNLRRIK